jgi:hypothetical protein
MAKIDAAALDVSDIGLKELAEPHVKAAISQLAKLVEHQDPRISLEAAQAILRIARPHSRGVWDIPISTGPSWGDLWGSLEGGNRAG